MPQHSGLAGDDSADDHPLADYEPTFRRRARTGDAHEPHARGAVAPEPTPREDHQGPDAFVEDVPSRDELPGYMRPSGDSDRWWLRPLLALVLLALTIGGLMRSSWRASAVEPSGVGTLVVSSHPSSASVSVDGEIAGTTPLAIDLAVGAHDVDVRVADGRKQLQVEIRSARHTTRHVTFDEALPAATATTGHLHVDSDPSGAEVFIDGRRTGVTPVTVADLGEGPHAVEVRAPVGAAAREVTITAGATSNLYLALSTPGPGMGGWIVPPRGPAVEIFEGDRLVGTSAQSRIMLPAGRHALTLVSEPLGFRHDQTVTITPASTVALRVDWPTAPLNVNALPWAEVKIDGNGVGQTPLGALALPIGTHQVEFAHPTLGSRTLDVVVRLGATNRISADLRK